MNESKSSRYHRAKRRTSGATILISAGLLAALIFTGTSAWLRDAVAGSVSAYVAVLALLYALATLPAAWYRTCHLERQYQLSHVSAGVWLRDSCKFAALGVVLGAAAAELVYFGIRLWPRWWWMAATASLVGVIAAVTCAAPVLILPLFHRSRPLARNALRRRLLRLSERAGIAVLDVYEWGLGEKTRRASAALVGAGATRRILLSDTLLADFTDDEIEVVLAHEMGHHLHGDVLKGLAAEFVVLLGGFSVAAIALDRLWKPLGLASPADVAGLPIVLLATGGVSLLATPFLNAQSRRNERRADRFALELTARPDAFVAAMRRMAAQNLADEDPPRAAFWLFHTHPRVRERVERAQSFILNP